MLRGIEVSRRKAMTRGFVAPAFVGCAFIDQKILAADFYLTCWCRGRQAAFCWGIGLCLSVAVSDSRVGAPFGPLMVVRIQQGQPSLVT